MAAQASLKPSILFWPFIVKPKVSKSDQSQKTQDIAKNQSKLKAKACKSCQGWENVHSASRAGKDTQATLSLVLFDS